MGLDKHCENLDTDSLEQAKKLVMMMNNHPGTSGNPGSPASVALNLVNPQNINTPAVFPIPTSFNPQNNLPLPYTGPFLVVYSGNPRNPF